MDEFWRARRVLLTGHTGFKGAWLTLWLEALGADVTGYALQPAWNDGHNTGLYTFRQLRALGDHANQ